MIGKSLSERHGLTKLAPARATAILTEALVTQAKPIVEVRAEDARLVACVVVGATKPAMDLCRKAGLEIASGGSGVFGVPGAMAVALLPRASAAEKAWLETPCGARETKVLLIADAYALLSLETVDGRVTIVNGP